MEVILVSVLATRFENNCHVLTQRFYHKHDNIDTKIFNWENEKKPQQLKDGMLFFQILEKWKKL